MLLVRLLLLLCFAGAAYGLYRSSHALSILLRSARRRLKLQLHRPEIHGILERLTDLPGWTIESIGMRRGTAIHEDKDLLFTITLDVHEGTTYTHLQLSAPQHIPLECRMQFIDSPTAILPPSKQEPHESIVPAVPTFAWDLYPSHFPNRAIPIDYPHFVPDMHLEGVEAELLAIWTPARLQSLRTLFERHEFVVEHGSIKLNEQGLYLNPEACTFVLERMLDLLERITLDAKELPKRLLEHVMAEQPIHNTQQRCLELLYLMYPQSETFQQATQHALQHALLPTQLSAAFFMREKGLAFLQEHALALPKKAEKPVLHMFKTQLSDPAKATLLNAFKKAYQTSLEESQPKEQVRLLRCMAILGGVGALSVLFEGIDTVINVPFWKGKTKGGQSDPVMAFLEGFRLHFQEENERFLLPLLEWPDQQVACTTAQILEDIGTPTSIAAIGQRLERADKKSPIAQALRRALEAIQMRSAHLSAGNLALFHPAEEGAISLAPTTQGGLSEAS